MRRHSLAAGLVVLLLGWRFYQVRGLAFPPWVDSVHHALLVRLLTETSLSPGPPLFPQTWAPYLPQVPFFYHFGFHLPAAVYSKVFRLDAAEAVLVTGQLWQAALGAAVYVLAYRLSGKRTNAVMSLLLVAFGATMPAHYNFWGRYTLLAGQALMAFGMAAAAGRRPVVLACLVAATAITHYYALVLLLLYLGLLWLQDKPRRRQIFAGVVGGLLLASPWLALVLIDGARMLRVAVDASPSRYQPGYLAYLLGPAPDYVLLALGLTGGGLVVAAYLRRRAAVAPPHAALTLWFGCLLLLLAPFYPGPFRPDHAAIVLFVPLCVLAPEAVMRLRRPRVMWAAAAVLCAWGAWSTRMPIGAPYVIGRADDRAALAWVDTHLPSDAAFLIDTTAWGRNYRGIDGGWWAAPATGRRTVPPPAVYLWGPRPSIDEINGYAARLSRLGELPDRLYCQELALLSEQTGARYYYTHEPRPAACEHLAPVYEDPTSRLTIFKIMTDARIGAWSPMTRPESDLAQTRKWVKLKGRSIHG